MKRAAMVIVVVAVATARAGAGDYPNPQTNNSGGFYMAPRLSDLRQSAANTASPYSPVSYAPATRTSYSQPATTSYVQAGPSCGTRSCGSCGQCGSCGKGHCDDRTCCQKLKDFLCWRPSSNCFFPVPRRLQPFRPVRLMRPGARPRLPAVLVVHNVWRDNKRKRYGYADDWPSEQLTRHDCDMVERWQHCQPNRVGLQRH